MKKIAVALLLMCVQNSYSALKDTLQNEHRFQKYAYLIKDLGEEYCDACGCSANGGSMGFGSMLNDDFIGVRYVYQKYTTKEGVFNNSPWIEENFNTIQFWSRIPLTSHIQLMALIPFHNNNRLLNTGYENRSGLGDITVVGLYTFFQSKKDSLSNYSHKVQLGGGLKAPTGKFDESNSGTLNPSFQLGTGSWDYLFITEYVIKRQQSGLNMAFSYTYKTENQKHYQFGNQLNYSVTLFHLLHWNHINFVPQIGLAEEVTASNRQFQQDVVGTKGDVLFSKLGLEVGKGRFSLGMNAMLPLKQNLTDGNVKAKYRVAVNLNYIFQ